MSAIPAADVHLPRPLGLLVHLAAWARPEPEVLRRARERLAEYDERLLRDIGLTRDEAMGHATRPHPDSAEWDLR